MTKNKLTLKDEFYEKAPTFIQTEDYWNFFLPYLKIKTPKSKIEIPQDKIEEFNQLWPEFKLSTGKYGRSTMLELNSSFQAFFKVYPTYTDWNIILESARIYLMEREQENFEFTKRSKYFVRKQNKDGSSAFELGEYYERIRDGIQEVPRDDRRFEPKIL